MLFGCHRQKSNNDNWGGIISNWITLLAKRRTKAAPKIDENESFGHLRQVVRGQRIQKPMNDQQASEEANSFALRLDELTITRKTPRTYSCYLEGSVLFNK